MLEEESKAVGMAPVEEPGEVMTPAAPVSSRRGVWWLVGAIVVVLVLAGGVVWWVQTQTDPDSGTAGEVSVDPSTAELRLTSDGCGRLDVSVLGESWTVDGELDVVEPLHVSEAVKDATGLGELTCSSPIANGALDLDANLIVQRIAFDDDRAALDAVNQNPWIDSVESGRGVGVMADASALSDVCVDPKAAVAYSLRDGDPQDADHWSQIVVGCRTGNMATIVAVQAIRPRPANNPADTVVQDVLMPLVRDAVAKAEQTG